MSDRSLRVLNADWHAEVVIGTPSRCYASAFARFVERVGVPIVLAGAGARV